MRALRCEGPASPPSEAGPTATENCSATRTAAESEEAAKETRQTLRRTVWGAFRTGKVLVV